MLIFEHWFLVNTNSQEEAKKIVEKFLNKYQLIFYDKIESLSILNGFDLNFFNILHSGVNKNKEIIEELINELEKEGYKTLKDLADLPQGYLSKILHTVVHLIDGFMGIDSYFYNLIEDSHFVSKNLIFKIKQDPGNYYLVKIKGYTEISEPFFEWLKSIKKPLK